MSDRRDGGEDRSRGLDRIRAPDPREPRQRDVRGKRALYSVDSEANPTSVVIVACPQCGVQRGLTLAEVPSLLRPPWVCNPFSRTLWARCPTCEQRAWLGVKLGPGIPWPFSAPSE